LSRSGSSRGSNFDVPPPLKIVLAAGSALAALVANRSSPKLKGVEAVAAYRRACEIDPQSLKYRNIYRDTALYVAEQAQEKGDDAGAVAVLRELVAVDPDIATAWDRLAKSYQVLGRPDDASAARAHVERLAPKP